MRRGNPLKNKNKSHIGIKANRNKIPEQNEFICTKTSDALLNRTVYLIHTTTK